ncbi:HMG (high mobility group) box family protein [Brugia pahangi]|uniref:Sex-determining region Y protein n=2 Tax=Brugia TaxID=6278 RepID=A0A1I9G485_BRUMA|nr:Bm10737 [Brugia malayi]VDN93890.1 unnamed protein product [Brugia pahangi]
MSVDESRSSTPLVSTSASSSPAASSSLPDSQGTCFNGYQSGIGENARVESPSHVVSLPNNIYMHRIQSASPADDHQFIRRPLNAYMIFTKQERKKLLALNPNMKMHEASRIMGEKWKNMSEKEKRQYFEASKQNRLDHKKSLCVSSWHSASSHVCVYVRVLLTSLQKDAGHNLALIQSSRGSVY